MIKSSIDLGTNTCLLLVGEWDAKSQQVTRVIHDQSTLVRLGQNVDKTKRLHPDAVDRTRTCLKVYASQLIELGLKPSETIAVATATARDADNGVEFFSEIEKDFGFRFQILTGDEEARYMFLGGLLPDSTPEESIVIDIGGGSTELRSFESGVSLPMGSVRFTERFLKSDPVTDQEFWACQDAIDEMLESVDTSSFTGKSLVGVAGSIVTLAQWQWDVPVFDSKKLDGSVLTRGDVHRLVEGLKWRAISERKELMGMEAGRADVILAGALILWRAMELFDFSEIKISTRGLRFGILAK